MKSFDPQPGSRSGTTGLHAPRARGGTVPARQDRGGTVPARQDRGGTVPACQDRGGTVPARQGRGGRRSPPSLTGALLVVAVVVGAVVMPARADRFDELVRELGHTNEETRAEAADQLAHLGGPRAEQQFRQMLTADSPEHRQMGVAGLLQVNDSPEDLGRVRARLQQDDNSQVRWTAALALGQAGWPESIPWLQAAATNDAADLVREAATEASGRLQAGVPWRRAVEGAQREAKDLGKPVLVYFNLRQSEYCRRFEEGVLADQAVVDALQEFVPVRLDAAQAAEQARRWDVRGAPTVLVLDAAGNEMDRIAGLVEQGTLLRRLGEARRGKLTLREAKRQAAQHPEDVAANWKLARAYLDDGREDLAEPPLRRVIEHDADNQHGYTDNALFALGFALGRRGAYAQGVVCLEELLQRWPQFKDKDKALYCLGLSRLALGRREDGAAALGQLVRDHPDSSTAAAARAALQRLGK